jgi:two-component sensor histidine kinase
MNREIQTCRDVSKRLEQSIQMVQEAAELAKKRKVDMLARQQRRVTQLESLRALVRKKEEEVSCLSAAAIHPLPDNCLPSFAISSEGNNLLTHFKPTGTQCL